MGQKWNPSETEVDESQKLIEMAAERRMALRDVRAMEATIARKYHLAQRHPDR
jgi:hypothetical protein